MTFKTLDGIPEHMEYELERHIGKYTVDLNRPVDETSKSLVQRFYNSLVKIHYSMVDNKAVVIHIEEVFFNQQVQ